MTWSPATSTVIYSLDMKPSRKFLGSGNVLTERTNVLRGLGARKQGIYSSVPKEVCQKTPHLSSFASHDWIHLEGNQDPYFANLFTCFSTQPQITGLAMVCTAEIESISEVLLISIRNQVLTWWGQVRSTTRGDLKRFVTAHLVRLRRFQAGQSFI